ncbi:MAG TPA: Ig-like domain-containing protein [Candidatus Hydrogenedentes bacterium]|nr:Ig-like domain-containing protein [Candidatus Hydrogenedentota bacterium]
MGIDIECNGTDGRGKGGALFIMEGGRLAGTGFTFTDNTAADASGEPGDDNDICWDGAQAPYVSTIGRLDTNPNTGPSVRFSVAFSSAVLGVDATDFVLTTDGDVQASISNVVAGTVLGTPVTTMFDTELEGWTVTGNDVTPPTWDGVEGNPPGSAACTDVIAGVFYWKAPAAYLGDRSLLYGSCLLADLRVDITPNYADSDVKLEGAGTTLAARWPRQPSTFWETFSVPLVASGNWTNTGTGLAPTESEFLGVLADLTGLYIRGEYSSVSGDRSWIDNVRFGDACGEGTSIQWTITVGVQGTGTLRLDLVDDDSIVTSIGVPLAFMGVTGETDGSYSNGEVYDIDTEAPGVVLSTTAGDPNNLVPCPLTVTFDEPVFGFEDDDLILTNATAVRTSGVDGDSEYSFDLTPVSDGLVSVELPVGAAQDAMGNPSEAAIPLSYTFDGTGPVPVVNSTASDPTDTAPIPYEVSFDEAVYGFTTGGLTVSNGTAANFMGVDGDSIFTFDVFPAGDGTVSVTVPAGAAQDVAGNPNTESNAFSVVYDTEAPYVLSVVRVGPALTNAAVVDFQVTFSEPVTGIASSDFTVDSGAKALIGAAVSGVNGSGAVYTVMVNTGEGEGSLSIDVLSIGAILDAAGRLMDTPFTAGESYDVDRVPPSVVITSTASDPTDDNPIAVTILFSESVTGFEEGDLAATNAAVTNLTGAGGSYSLDLSPLSEGQVRLDIPEGAAFDAAGNGNLAAASFTRTYTEEQVCDRTIHSADTNADYLINLSELLRVIQFFNSETFSCQEGTEDGYIPGLGDTDCCPHASDYLPQNWDIGLSELLRLVQFYNSGGYHQCEGSEDGYCPGPSR